MQKKKLYRTGFIITGLVCTSFILSGCVKKAQKKVSEREIRVGVQKIEKRIFRRQIICIWRTVIRFVNTHEKKKNGIGL
jgi:hypothetical protein